MKTYNLEEIKKLTKNSANYIYDTEQEEQQYTLEELDKAKTRILKFIIYKKRTENEVRKKFINEYSEDLLEDIINYLKENGYINDSDYVERAVNEFTNLKHLSIKEIKYKLIAKGVKMTEIDNYIDSNYNQLLEYEIKSAQYWKQKKENKLESLEIKKYLIKKGYKEESIKEAL